MSATLTVAAYGAGDLAARRTVTNLGPNGHARFTTDGGTFACTVLGAGTLMLFR